MAARPCLTDFRQPAAFRNERRISTPSHFLGRDTIFSSHEVMYTAACFFRCCFVKWTSLPLKLHLWKKHERSNLLISEYLIIQYKIHYFDSKMSELFTARRGATKENLLNLIGSHEIYLIPWGSYCLVRFKLIGSIQVPSVVSQCT